MNQSEHNPDGQCPDEPSDADVALAVIRAENRASVSLLQRRLRWGYIRAKAATEVLQQQGFLGEGDGIKPLELRFPTVSAPTDPAPTTESVSIGSKSVEAPCGEKLPFQSRVHPWLLACFGQEIADDKQERNHRFCEEALELVQSTGCTQSEAHQLVDYVFNRPVGIPNQEVGGVMVTLAALCLAQGLDMHHAGEQELNRIWTKVDKIRAKQAAKPKHSPLPEVTESSELATLRETLASAELKIEALNISGEQVTAKLASVERERDESMRRAILDLDDARHRIIQVQDENRRLIDKCEYLRTEDIKADHQISTLTFERDAARAEVERLKGILRELGEEIHAEHAAQLADDIREHDAERIRSITAP